MLSPFLNNLIKFSLLLAIGLALPLPVIADLSVPSTLISLDSEQGEKMLLDSNYKSSYWQLSRYFISEENIAFCSVASMVMVLNALNIERPLSPDLYPYSLFTQSNVFNNPTVVKMFQPRAVASKGLSLQQLANFTSALGVKNQIYFAANDTGLSEFRKTAKNVLSNQNSYLIINFNRQALGEVGQGHFSPIAAYDPGSDSFLLMDVARYKYPPTWIKADTLWKAMEDNDGTSKKPRGYLVLTN